MKDIHKIAVELWNVGKSLHDYSLDDDLAAIGFELKSISKRLLDCVIKLEKLKNRGDEEYDT